MRRDAGSLVAREGDLTLPIRGQKLFVREQGEGRPLLLINGLGANLEMWGPATERLSRVARTISFDAPGMGRSRTSSAILSHPGYARMICRLLDRLGVEETDVLGYSFGGTIAQQLARTAPERVRRMALVGTSCGWGSVPPEARALALISTPLRYYSRIYFEQTSYLLDGRTGGGDGARLRAQADARLRQPPSLLGYTQQFIAGSTWSSLHWLSTLKVPTLVVAGERDRLVPPANALMLARHLPRSRVHILPGEGHLLLFDEKSAGLPLLVDFFGSPRLEDSGSWSTGLEVDSDEVVEASVGLSPGVQPLKAYSSAYRRWVGLRPVRGLAARLKLL
ncbi:MAG TPA: alpha/beta hydrolase [Solirubrobacteraceae bacterium]|jgi:pimeloyl-ACP methyl ester carboxylesterase|nr:alpha/beta hydrolase [Solirubrobacteraceae bacterium]